MRPEIIVGTLAVWTWTLLPASVHLSMAGRTTGPVMVSGAARTAPNVSDITIVDLNLHLDSTTSITLTGPWITAESNATTIVQGSMNTKAGSDQLSWNATLTSSRDFNGQELLHLKAAASAPTEGPIELEAWYLRTDPPTEYVPFCSSEE